MTFVGLQVTVGDGLVATENAAESSEASLDFLIVDAGSSDSSLAMSCPPPAFLEPRCLQHARRALKDTGLLVINCVTRSEKAFASALAAVQVLHSSNCLSIPTAFSTRSCSVALNFLLWTLHQRYAKIAYSGLMPIPESPSSLLYREVDVHLADADIPLEGCVRLSVFLDAGCVQDCGIHDC